VIIYYDLNMFMNVKEEIYLYMYYYLLYGLEIQNSKFLVFFFYAFYRYFGYVTLLIDDVNNLY
jgi:hypothetical protein